MNEFLVFGSLLKCGAAARDIDLVVPEFTDGRMYDAEVSLKPYEELWAATGKPIDLFFGTKEGDFNLAAVFDGQWTFRMTLCSDPGGFFSGMRRVSRQALINSAKICRTASR